MSYRSAHALEPLLGYLRGLGVAPAVQILPVTPQPLRAAGIVDALRQAGRTDESAANISVCLDGLLRQGRVARVARGEYTVPG